MAPGGNWAGWSEGHGNIGPWAPVALSLTGSLCFPAAPEVSSFGPPHLSSMKFFHLFWPVLVKVLGIYLRTSHVPGRCHTAELYPSPFLYDSLLTSGPQQWTP